MNESGPAIAGQSRPVPMALFRHEVDEKTFGS